MKISKKNIIFAALIVGSSILPTYKVFSDELDDCFKGDCRIERRSMTIGSFSSGNFAVQLPIDISYKYAYASTRFEENGYKTYRGKHYLRCYRKNEFGFIDVNTGRHWFTVGSKIESERVMCPAGGFKSCYGKKPEPVVKYERVIVGK